MNVGVIAKMSKTIEKFTVDNAPTILTGVGVVGTLATAYLTGRGTVEACKRVSEKKFIKHLHEPATEKVKVNEQDLSKLDVVKLTWTCYLPPVAAATITIGSIVMANQINAKRLAALAAGYGLLDNRFEEYKAKIQEKLGVKKEDDVRTEIAQEHVDKNPPPSTIVVAANKTLFRDEPSGRYFESTMEDVRRAENDLNRKIIKDEYAVLTDWYELLGLTPTSMSEDFGWDISDKETFGLLFNTVITPDQKPCITMDYTVKPIRNGYNGGGSSKIRAV